MDINHIIEPERHGLWIASGFIVALFALVLGLAAIQKIDTVLVGTQLQVMVLNDKIESMKGNQAKAQSDQPQQAAPESAAK